MKHSFILLVDVVLFLVLDGVVFFTYKKNIEKHFYTEVEVVFWKIQAKSSELLSELLYNYSLQVEKIRAKHRFVQQVIESSGVDPLRYDLKPLYKQINEGVNPPRYNIYLTDKSFVIQNTTFVNDLGFDLSFAKDIFEHHLQTNTIGVSTPLFESSERNFFSYSDSFYKYKGKLAGILQISYIYREANVRLGELRRITNKDGLVSSVKAYTQLNDSFIVDIKLDNIKSRKPEIDEVLAKKIEGERIEQLLKKQGLYRRETDGTVEYFFNTHSPINSQMKILYSVKFSKQKLKEELVYLYEMGAFATLLGLVILVILVRFFQKEQRLMWQDIFIQSSMHQLKTPLTLIRINNEMQSLQVSHNNFFRNIEAGVRTLQNSFEDMHFFFKNQTEYPLESLCLREVLAERVEHFEMIASAYEKEFVCEYDGDVKVFMSREELVRLIDNNLSNAIKYAKPDTKIVIVLEHNRLSFTTQSQPIKEKKQIFEKYYREESAQGGHGLGLFIVASIAKKYKIKKEVRSVEGKTTFCYIFEEMKR